MSRRGGKWGMGVRLLAAFALVFLSFAHKPMLAKASSSATSAEFLLPDGTFADICFGTAGVDHEADRDKQPSNAPVCEACRLAASVLVPTPPEASLPADNGHWLAAIPFLTAEAVLSPLRLLPPSRGPPALS